LVCVPVGSYVGLDFDNLIEEISYVETRKPSKTGNKWVISLIVATINKRFPVPLGCRLCRGMSCYFGWLHGNAQNPGETAISAGTSGLMVVDEHNYDNATVGSLALVLVKK
jgi:hypothetical protein